MSGKNKGGNNGFYFFMLDYQKKHGKNKYPTLDMVSSVVGPIWSRMSKEERQPYDMRAKQLKGGDKYTSQGVSIKQIEREEQERAMQEERMKHNIKKIIQNAISSDCLPVETFYVMHMNYFCQHVTTKKYYPAEVGVSRFTLQHGVDPVNDVYHSLIHPGPLPIGYSFEAKNFSGRTHQLEIPTSTSEEDNTYQVFEDILHFLEKHKVVNKYPPVFVNNNNMAIVSSVLNEFCLEFDGSIKLEVYSLEFLLYMIRNNVGNGSVWPSITFAKEEIEKDVYACTDGIACEFHENTDVAFHCSRSHVIRTIYIICDNCCNDLNIELIPGRHVPKNAAFYDKQTDCDNASYVASSSRSVIASTSDCYDRLDDISVNDFYESEPETRKHAVADKPKPLTFVEHANDDDDDWQVFRRNKKTDYTLSQGSSLGFYALGQDDSSFSFYDSSQDSVQSRPFKNNATGFRNGNQNATGGFRSALRGRRNNHSSN